MESYQKALKLDPALFEAHYNLAVAAFQSHELSLALLEYQYAMALAPDSADARFRLKRKQIIRVEK